MSTKQMIRQIPISSGIAPVGRSYGDVQTLTPIGGTAIIQTPAPGYSAFIDTEPTSNGPSVTITNPINTESIPPTYSEYLEKAPVDDVVPSSTENTPEPTTGGQSGGAIAPEATNSTGTSTGQSTSQGDTNGSSQNGSGSTSQNGVMTYEEYVSQAYANAERKRQQNLVSNASAYEKANPLYGTQADALARMGLQGSGYTDYLAGQSYLAKANADSRARAVESLEKQNADASYQQYVEKARSEVESNIISMVNSGNFTYEQIKSYADIYGLGSSPYLQFAQSAISNKETTTNKNTLAEFINSGAYSPTEIKSYADSLGLGNDISVTTVNKQYLESAKQAITINTTDAQIDALDSTAVSTEMKNELKTQRDQLFIDAVKEESGMSFDEVYTAIRNALKNGKLTKAGLNKAMEALYINDINSKHTDTASWTMDDVITVNQKLYDAYGRGDLSAEGYKAAVNHLYEAAGEKAKKPVEWDEDINAWVYGGQTFKMKNAREGDKMTSVLNGIATRNGSKAPENGAIVRLGDDYYIYTHYPAEKAGWYYVKKYGGTISNVFNDR